MNALWTLAGVSVELGGVRALSGLQLTIAHGERVAFVGSNGCGKSTLLRLLHGLLSPTRGQLRCDASQRQAMVFQRPWMLRTSALNNIALGLWLRGQRWPTAQAQAQHALDRVGLGELARRPARALSGGQQQRLAMARAWALQPEVLLLDEPTANLDPHAKREIEALMAEFARQNEQLTMVFASHNLGQVKRLAHRVIYLEQGVVLADLPVERFFDHAQLEQTCPAAALFVKGEML